LDGISNSYSGATTINEGTLRAGAIQAFSPSSAVVLANVVGATLDLNSFNQTIPTLSGGGTSGGFVSLGSATLTTGNATNTTFFGSISGSGGLTIQGTGTFTLGGTNNIYSGATTINNGTLQAGAPNAFSQFSAVTMANLATAYLNLNNFNQVIPSLSGGGVLGGNVNLGSGTLTTGNNTNSTYSGVITGSGGLTLQGTGTFTLTNSNTYQGLTTISSGVLTFTGSTSGLSGNIIDNSTLIFNQSGSSSVNGQISGTGTVIQNGSATLMLNNNNSYQGNTTINSGVLLAGTTGAFSPYSAVSLANVAGATLDLGGLNQSVLSLSGGGALGGNVSLGAGTLTLSNANGTFSGQQQKREKRLE
jgi:autotransporter-associated beta strand protein